MPGNEKVEKQEIVPHNADFIVSGAGNIGIWIRENQNMHEYEVTMTYLNGCAGAAYPLTSFEEVQAQSPEMYLQGKHPKEYSGFVKEELPGGQMRYTFSNGAVTFIYEFTEI